MCHRTDFDHIEKSLPANSGRQCPVTLQPTKSQSCQSAVFCNSHQCSTVVALFILFYMMDVFGSICYYFDVCELTEEFHYIRKLLLIANSAANPFPYAFIKRHQKRIYENVLLQKTK